MSVKENMILCLSGFDPTGGAGILADIKTIEATGMYGMGIITANTIQTEELFLSSGWVAHDYIIKQLTTLLNAYRFNTVKIGITESLGLLLRIINIIKDKNPDIKIIWDPVLKSSTGHDFHSQINEESLHAILSKIYLITPNIPEYKILFNDKKYDETGKKSFALLLKGGHSKSDKITDKLYINNKEILFNGNKSKSAKHGSGCVLSSAIASFVSQGYSLIEACEKSKDYMNYFINSDHSLLGKHLYNYESN